MMIPRFRSVFPKGHVVLPVIHVMSLEQAKLNADIARQAGSPGIFLINHSMSALELLTIHESVSRLFPNWWIGVNCLGVSPLHAVGRVSQEVAGVWSDNAMIQETNQEQPDAAAVVSAIRERGWPGVYFGGVAFKYQRDVDNLAKAARIAREYMDVVTTSGPGTGQPAHVEKIKTMKSALGAFPLAIASGITPENVRDYLPFSDCYLVATGISDSFVKINPGRLRDLLNTVRTWDENNQCHDECIANIDQ